MEGVQIMPVREVLSVLRRADGEGAVVMCAAYNHNHNHNSLFNPNTRALRIIEMYEAGFSRTDIMKQLKINSTGLSVIEDKISDYYKLYTMEECASAWRKEKGYGRR